MPKSGFSCLHIGMPRTGTTTLQTRLYPEHSQIFYLGKFYHPLPLFLNRQVEDLLTQIRDQHLGEQQLSALRSQFETLTAPGLEAGKRPLWSDEETALTSLKALKKRAHAFRVIFGPCKILITMREPISYIKSMYLHLLTTYQVDRHRRLMNRGLRRPYAQKPRFLPIEQWLQELGFDNHSEERFSGANLIDVASIAEIFEENFGPEHVGIFLFEQMVEDLPAYVADVSRFLGIGEDEMLSRIGGHREAKRVSQETVDRLREICESPVKTTIFRVAPQWLRYRMAGLKPERAEPSFERAETIIPDVWERRILEVARDSHQRLLHRRSLPFERYGYPI